MKSDIGYQEKLQGYRKPDVILEPLKNLIKSQSLHNLPIYDSKQSTNTKEQTNMLNKLFLSVVCPKHEFSVHEILTEQPLLTNFDLYKKTINSMVSSLDISRLWGQNGLPPAFFQNPF